MRSKRGRIDRFIAKHQQMSLRQVKHLMAAGRVRLDGQVINDVQQPIDEFSHIQLDEQSLQENAPIYILLHKPKGVISATYDKQHPTVIDLLDHEYKQTLHLVGRLDKNSTGLVLLTNNSRWSQAINHREQKIAKRYRVQVANPITEAMVTAFAEGIYFTTEQRYSLPAQLRPLDDFHAEVILYEGMYHQIKRMFGHFRNPVLVIHRIAVGALTLPKELAAGQWQQITEKQAQSLFDVTAVP